MGLLNFISRDSQNSTPRKAPQAGVPIKTVSERLGHANATITLNVYVHSTPAQHDQAAAVLGALVE
jgi:integrase